MRIHSMAAVLCAAAALGGFCLSRPAPADPEPQAGVTLAETGLSQFITGMGYEPKDLGNHVYYVTLDRGGYTCYVQIALSGSGRKLWLSGKLGKLGGLDQVPAAALA